MTNSIMRIGILTVAAAAWSLSASAQSAATGQLTAAAQDCRAGEVADLLGRGADVEAKNTGGYTPLMLAAGNGCKEVVRLLLERGADVAVKHPTFGDAAAQAKMHQHLEVQAMIEGKSRQQVGLAGPAPGGAADSPPSEVPVARAGGSATWPKLGRYAIGQRVLYSGSGGKTWSEGIIKSIDDRYGYNIEGVTGSSDPYFVVGTKREPFWTGYFVGDWKVSVPVAIGAVTDGTYVYRTVSGGMRLPPLRINADGSYTWRVQEGKGERLIRGRWTPNPSGPGVILQGGERGADWLVYNNSNTGSQLGETVILSSDCCSHYDGSRLK